jgi:phosphatidylserine decarboxylase
MDWTPNLYGLVLALVILVPLGRKWDIDRKVTIPAAACIGFVSGFAVKALEVLWAPGNLLKLSMQIIVILSLAAALLLWRFFRDPERDVPPGSKTIVSPADGKVIYVKRTEDGRLPLSEKNGEKYSLNEFVHSDMLPVPGTLIGISMNFLDVHVNRAPIQGRIAASQRISGLFLSLRLKEAVLRNERRLMVIDNGSVKIGVVQIASRLVRSIIPFVKDGSEVMKGQRIGMIRFGSQVDVYIPHTLPVQVSLKIGQKVKAGLSVLATFETNVENRATVRGAKALEEP